MNNKEQLSEALEIKRIIMGMDQNAKIGVIHSQMLIDVQCSTRAKSREVVKYFRNETNDSQWKVMVDILNFNKGKSSEWTEIDFDFIKALRAL